MLTQTRSTSLKLGWLWKPQVGFMFQAPMLNYIMHSLYKVDL